MRGKRIRGPPPAASIIQRDERKIYRGSGSFGPMVSPRSLPAAPTMRVLKFALVGCLAAAANLPPSQATAQTKTNERLQYHVIRVDSKGMILPWQSDDLGRAFDSTVRSTFKFWDNMAPDRNGLPYHMNHQVWRPLLDDHRGIGGDQIQMALSSWALLYQYLGNESEDEGHRRPSFGRIVENMRFMADWYITHGFSGPKDKWPNLPYPYNTLVYSGIYDGDMILGAGYTQPDKAGSLGWELLALHKITENARYLDTAVAIANTLAAKTVKGDKDNSPLPFKVHAQTGQVGQLINKDGTIKSSYTTNWAGALRLYEELIRLKKGNAALYKRAFDTTLAWMKAYPLKSNKWGPFFEDIQGWSDTQINAVTFADFIMDHRELFPNWRKDVQGIFDWVHANLANDTWKKYGVVAINEQTAYRVPGNSHTTRQAAAELRFAELTGDEGRKAENVRRLSWATYHVDVDGKNRYIQDDVWMTDGYGDFVRHYLRAMAAAPELTPADQDHILRSTTVISRLRYDGKQIAYRTFEAPSTEMMVITAKPKAVRAGAGKDIELKEVADLATGEGWTFTPLGSSKRGVLRVRHDSKTNVTIEK